MPQAKVDEETRPKNAASLGARRSRRRTVPESATHGVFGHASTESHESDQDADEGSADLPVGAQGGFIEILTPLAGQMAFEIVTALFAGYRDMEGAYGDLQRMYARLRSSEEEDWTRILEDLSAFMRRCAPLLPEAMRSKVAATCDALDQVDRLWHLCLSLRQTIDNPDLAWHDKAGLLWSALARDENTAFALPDAASRWIAHAAEAQKQFTTSLQAIQCFESRCKAAESGGPDAIDALRSEIARSASGLPRPLQNFLHDLPVESEFWPAYRDKIGQLREHFEKLGTVRSVSEALPGIKALIAEGLIDMQGSSPSCDPGPDVAIQISQWCKDLTNLRVVLSGTLTAETAMDALAQVSAALDLSTMRQLLGERLAGSLGLATQVLAGLGESFGYRRGIHGRLVAEVDRDVPLLKKLKRLARLISQSTLIPEDIRPDLVDVPQTLDTLATALSFGSMDTQQQMMEQIAKGLDALKELVERPLVRKSMGVEASMHIARVIETISQALDIAGLLEKQLHHEATFETFLRDFMNMRGTGTALSESLEEVSGLADSILQSLEPDRSAHRLDSADAVSKVGKLGALVRWLGHPDAGKLVLSGVPARHKEAAQNAIKLYREIVRFPALGSWDSQRVWVREHLVKADTLQLLMGADGDRMKRWQSALIQNDAALMLLKRLLPLINSNNLTVSSVHSALRSREAVGVARQALSAGLFYVDNTVLYGVGTVVEQGIGLGMALSDPDAATRQRTVEAVLQALEGMVRSAMARSLIAANPGMALLADALYSIIFRPMLWTLLTDDANAPSGREQQSYKDLATTLARDFLNGRPNAMEIKERLKRFASTSPALEGSIRAGMNILEGMGQRIWEVHLALDVYLLLFAGEAERVERQRTLAATLETLRAHGHEWAGPLATLAPLLSDLYEARMLVKRELPEADTWFEWSAKLSSMLAESNAPPVFRLRKALANQVATSLRNGFNRLVEPRLIGETGHGVKADFLFPRADSQYAAWIALAPKLGRVAGPLLKRAAERLQLPLISSAIARLHGAQPNETRLSEWGLATEYEHRDVALSEEDRVITAEGEPDPRGLYYKEVRRYIRVEGKTFGIAFDNHFSIIRLVKPDDSMEAGHSTGPAIVFRDGHWLITAIHKMRGGADDDATEELARIEAESLLREVQALLDVIESGTCEYEDADALRNALPDFQLTCEQLEAAVRALSQPTLPWTAIGMGVGLSVLGLLSLTYYWYTSRSPFEEPGLPRQDVSVNRRQGFNRMFNLPLNVVSQVCNRKDRVQTGHADAVSLRPLATDASQIVEMPLVFSGSAPTPAACDRVAKYAGVALLVSGGLVILGSWGWGRLWYRSEPGPSNDNVEVPPTQTSVTLSDSAAPTGLETPHPLEKRALEDWETQGNRSELELFLDQETGWDLGDDFVTMPGSIDHVLCVCSGGTYYIVVNAKNHKITRPQRVSFEEDAFQIEPSITHMANLLLRAGTSRAVVYSESLGWRFSQQWNSGTYPEITPEAPLNYFEHAEAQNPKSSPSYWLNAFLQAADGSAAYSGAGKPARRNVADPKRLFWTPQSGNLVKANKAYWPITWWRLTPSGSGRQALYTAAGHVTHGKANSDKTLFVYDEPRGWMPAVFANGEVHVFHTLETFHRFAARHRRTVKPLLLPSTKPLADQVIDRRLAVSGAIPNCMVFRGGTDLGHGVFSVVDSAWNTVVTKSYYYRKDDCYRKLDLKESSHEDGPIASSDLALYGHIGYEFEHEPYLLHLVFSKREGLLPSIMNDQGMLDGMRTVAGASNTSASPLLLELARRFGSEGTYTYAGQLPGKDGSLYHDLLGEPSELKMFLAGKYWPFEWKNASEGVVHVSFSDGSPYDVRLCLNDRNWTPEWGGRPTPPWLTECLKIMMSQGRMGVRLVGEAEKQWARRPLMDAPEVLRIVSVCLSRLEKENRAGRSDESWISVMILSTQLLAFFGREVKTGLTNLEFSPQVLVQLSRILAGEDVTERIDTAAMDDAADPTNSVTALEEIDGELKDIEAQQGNLSMSITTTKDVLKKAIHILTGKPSQIFSDVSFGDKLILASEVLWDYLLKSNDQTHNLIWAKKYLSWLTKTHKELETKKNALKDRREQLGSEDDYKRTWQAYRAGLERGKSFEKKYSFPIDWKSQRDDVNQRTLWAQYSGALAEVALRSQSRKLRGENNEAADAEADSASYFLWKRYSEISRFQQLIGAVGQKIKDKKIRPKGRYTDITDCVQFASDIIYEEDSNEIEFCHTDLALLAVLIYTISTTSKSLDNIREQDHEGLRTAFLEQSQMLHPYAVLPSKPQPYVSLAEVKPSSLMGSGNERYENYKKQFDSYREAGLSYDAGVLVRSGLENVQLRYENMYDIRTIVNLDIDWVGAKSRAHFIKLRDNSCLFYFISKSVTTEGLPERWSTRIEKSVTEWKTGMEWMPAMPMSANDVRDYGGALKAMQPYLGEALSNLTAHGKGQSVYFGEVKYKVDDKAESGGPEYQFTTTQEKIRVPEGTVLGTELVPYLLRETERDLDVMTDLLYTSMLELSQTDKWIGFFVLFYSEVRKASLDRNYRVDPFAILVDVTSLLLTVIPSAQATAQIVRGIRPMSMWTLGIRTGLHGRQLINHVTAQIPKKAMLKVGREVVSMLYELFFPFSFPFNTLTLNFRGLISKNRLLIMPRSPFEIVSDIHLVKGFLDNTILPAKIAALGKAPAKPKGRVQRVGPEIYRSEITVTVNENPYAIYYIKVKEDYYEIEWDPNFFQASLSNHSAPFAPWLRRRFADWVETTSPRGGGGSVSPMWAGPGVDRTSDQAKSRVQELRRAKSDALTLLRSARNVATSDASDIQVKVQKVFQMFWQDAGEAAIHSFASNVANIIGYLAQVSVSNDVAYLNNQEGAWLSAMPGSAFDLAQTRDVAASINGNDVDADHNQQAGAITGPGFVSENRITEPTRFIARSEIIPMAIRDDNFDVSAYQYDVTAYLVRANELCRNVIREGFVATTSNRRSLRKWDALLASEPLRLATLSDADRQLFIDQLSQTYGIFLFEGQPRSARPSAAFVEAGSRGWNATGDEVGVDISSLLRTDRTQSPGESATAARAADPDLFSYLVIVLSDIKADPARFADFTTRFSQAGVNDPLLWKWFQ